MATVTAAMVKELRDATGAGMMDCKKALVAADGNMQAAIDAMRKSGAAKAAKKAQLSKEQEAPKQEESPVAPEGHVYTAQGELKKTNLFDGLTLTELKEAQDQLTEAIMAAQAEEKRRADIRHQYETLRNAADKLLAENPWLK